jgi:hypothetical protein
MRMLTEEGWWKASLFVEKHARPLERRLYAFHFEHGAATAVLNVLAAFQNEDGGFGRALEPDVRAAESSVLATTVALQTAREIGAAEDHPLVKGAFRYLLAAYDPGQRVWPILPNTVEHAPRAPWWKAATLRETFRGFAANPRAEIVGYLYDYPALSPEPLRMELLNEVMAHLSAPGGALEMHDLLCYVRLAETAGLPDPPRSDLLEKLGAAVDALVSKDPSQWDGYALKPLDVVSYPESPLAERLKPAVHLNLDYLIDRQQADGSWAPAWSWFGEYPEEWPVAEGEWKGVLTLRALRLLHRFGRTARG